MEENSSAPFHFLLRSRLEQEHELPLDEYNIVFVVVVAYIYNCVEGVGASSNVCAETYAGPKALSEPENQALAQFVESFSGNIKAYISFHSYSQLFLFPWGHTAEHIDDYDLFVCLEIIQIFVKCTDLDVSF